MIGDMIGGSVIARPAEAALNGDLQHAGEAFALVENFSGHANASPLAFFARLS